MHESYSQKNIQAITHTFVCPACGGKLFFHDSIFICSCRRKYPIKNGIVLLNKKISRDDVRLSLRSWNRLYRKQGNRNITYQEALHNSYIQAYLHFVKRNMIRDYFIDIGAGNGMMALVVNKLYKKIPILIDFSLDALLEAKENFRSNKADGIFVCADITQGIFRKNSNQFFFSAMSLEYFKNLEEVFDHLQIALVKRGRMVFIIPKISLSTLTYHQLKSGDIPHVFGLKHIYEFIHLKVLKGKYLKTGYNLSYTISHMKKMVTKSGFKVIYAGDLIMDYQFNSISNKMVKSLFKYISKFSLFDPLMIFVIEK